MSKSVTVSESGAQCLGLCVWVDEICGCLWGSWITDSLQGVRVRACLKTCRVPVRRGIGAQFTGSRERSLRLNRSCRRRQSQRICGLLCWQKNLHVSCVFAPRETAGAASFLWTIPKLRKTRRICSGVKAHTRVCYTSDCVAVCLYYWLRLQGVCVCVCDLNLTQSFVIVLNSAPRRICQPVTSFLSRSWPSHNSYPPSLPPAGIP